MPVPNAASQGHYPVIKQVGVVAVGLGDAAEPLRAADGVLDLDAAAGVGLVAGAPLLRAGAGGGVGGWWGVAGRGAGAWLGARCSCVRAVVGWRVLRRGLRCGRLAG